MIFAQEDKERIAEQVKVQLEKAKERGELDESYGLYAVRFDQKESKGRPEIAIILKEPRPEVEGKVYYSIGWGAVRRRRGKLVFNKNEFVEWAEAGGVDWEGSQKEYDQLIGETTVTHPEWEYIVISE
jgi:hypothetical protein